MQYRSTTDEMLAARFDPMSYVNTLTGDRYPDEDSARHFTGGNHDYYTFAPRPQFIPTRDPEPWVSWGVRYATRQNAGCYFDPRPEYARPEPNPILVAARNDRMGKAYRTSAVAQWWLDAIGQHRQGVPFSILTDQILNRATPAQIEHARKVLTRLANIYKEA